MRLSRIPSFNGASGPSRMTPKQRTRAALLSLLLGILLVFMAFFAWYRPHTTHASSSSPQDHIAPNDHPDTAPLEPPPQQPQQPQQQQQQHAPPHPPLALHDEERRSDWRFTSLTFPEDASCEIVGQMDDLVPQLPSYPAPIHCRVGVVAVGMPRAGSTLQVMLLQRAMNLGITLAHLKGRFYYDMHKHTEMNDSTRDAHLKLRRDHIATVTKDDVYVVKTHEFRPELMRLCGGNVVIVSSRRDLYETTKSMMVADWMQGANIDQQVAAMIGFLKASIRRQECWIKAVEESPTAQWLEVDYQQMLADPKAHLTEFIKIAALDKWVTAAMIDRAATEVLAKEANPLVPASKKDVQLLDDQLQAQKMTLASPHMVAFQKKHNYPVDK